MRQFDFVFDELPLIVVDDVEACLINGEATVEYDRIGNWDVLHVTLDGYQAGKVVQVTAPPLLSALVLDRLSSTWRDKLEEAIAWQLHQDRASAADDYADIKRNQRELDL